MFSGRSKILLSAVACLVIGQVICALTLHRGLVLTAASDLVQCALLICAAIALLSNIHPSSGVNRWFWALLGTGAVLWLAYQLFWTYFELYLRRDVPDLWSGDSVLFLHVVPMMAALAIQPHLRRDDRTTRLGMLDFSLLLIWWVYLYIFTVMSWQFTMADRSAYARNMSHLYLAENLVYLLGLAILRSRSQSFWRNLYSLLFLAGGLYSLGSYFANWAIEKDIYYSGSFYDVPLVIAMAGLSLAGIYGNYASVPQTASSIPSHGVWVARVGMAAIFSLPLLAAWVLFDHSVPSSIRHFRLLATFLGMLVMGSLIFLKQIILDRELLQLLQHSENSFADLQRLQRQLVHSEKLASLGLLVGGAAHELNNPMTALLGYSELLEASSLNSEQQALTSSIREQIQRARGLVSDLLSFAKQGPGDRAPLDLNGLTQVAVKLLSAPARAHGVQFIFRPAPGLPRVAADSNQLLHVCSHILERAHQSSTKFEDVLVSTRTEGDYVSLEIHTKNLDLESLREECETDRLAPNKQEVGTGLVACRTIVEQHHGRLTLLPHSDAGAIIRVELPILGTDNRTKSVSPPRGAVSKEGKNSIRSRDSVAAS